jgi:SAM-dependent methyltransferase
VESIIQHLGHTDIYLLDQIMKGRYSPTDRVLDAGAGAGRNLHCFVQQGFQVFGTDRDPGAVEQLHLNYPGVPTDHFKVARVEDLPFPDASFEHVISSAVLHFAESEAHFEQMFEEMLRVLRPGGSLFIRMTTDVGLEDKVLALGHGRFYLPDGSERFLLTRSKLESLLQKHRLRLLEPFKTVLVEELRSMAVVVLER